MRFDSNEFFLIRTQNLPTDTEIEPRKILIATAAYSVPSYYHEIFGLLLLGIVAVFGSFFIVDGAFKAQTSCSATFEIGWTTTERKNYGGER